jgi:hypothetical protein
MTPIGERIVFEAKDRLMVFRIKGKHPADPIFTDVI